MTPNVVDPESTTTAQDMDPGIARLLDRKRERVRASGRYEPISNDRAQELLVGFFTKLGDPREVTSVSRVGGGASKEQFVFSLAGGGATERFILRMDPIQTASETDRQREAEALNAYSSHVPAPQAVWLDYEGENFGQPAAIMNFVDGVTKPTHKADGPEVTGIGTTFDADLRAALGPQYLEQLGRIHNVDWRAADLPSFDVPDADPYQPARWQLNWWARVWREDAVQVMPIAALAERWLRANLPRCEDGPTMVHGDYRTGNFLFDEDSKKITSILDWEYAHLGDFHEDLGWMLQTLYADVVDGEKYVTALIPDRDFIAEYERASGRTVNPDTLRWYRILCAYKCLAITLATSTKAARDSHNHQDVMLSWMAPVGHVFVTEICDLIEEASA